MPVTININNLSLAHRGSEGFSKATLPDVCKTPPGVPVPYPNITYSKDVAEGTTTVLADGGNMIAVKGSMFTPSQGDEPGTMGGVKSGVNMKESTWITYSMDVKFEGRNACRLTDKKWHNRMNTVNMAGHQQKPLPKACEYNWPDGSYVGAGNGKKCGPVESTKSKGITPSTKGANQAKASKRKIIYTNGIGFNECYLCYDLQVLANKFCAEVIGIYNASDGTVQDLGQAVGDKANLGSNPAADSLSNAIENSVRSGESMTLMGHSQGALITSRALNNAQNELAATGTPSSSSSWSKIEVTTFGGAAYTYPSGPEYTHMVNAYDPVPMTTGKGYDVMNPNVQYFADWQGDPAKNHSLSTYLNHVPQEPCT